MADVTSKLEDFAPLNGTTYEFNPIDTPTGINPTYKTSRSSVFDVYGSDRYNWHPGKGQFSQDQKSLIPYVILQEFDNQTDIKLQSMLYLKRAEMVGEDDVSAYKSFANVYRNIYATIPTGRIFRFPYFGEYPFSLKTTYSQLDAKSQISSMLEQGQELGQFFKNFGKKAQDFMTDTAILFESEEGVEANIRGQLVGKGPQTSHFRRRAGTTNGAQTIKTWTSAETGQYETKFTLINDTGDRLKAHYELIRTMLKALAPSFPNTMAVKVPFLYEIYIPSTLHLPLGFIGDFSATPKGYSYMTKSHFIVPEAWEIKLTFNSLFPISTQLLDTIDDPFNTNFGMSAEGRSADPTAQARLSPYGSAKPELEPASQNPDDLNKFYKTPKPEQKGASRLNKY